MRKVEQSFANLHFLFAEKESGALEFWCNQIKRRIFKFRKFFLKRRIVWGKLLLIRIIMKSRFFPGHPSVLNLMWKVLALLENCFRLKKPFMETYLWPCHLLLFLGKLLKLMPRYLKVSQDNKTNHGSTFFVAFLDKNFLSNPIRLARTKFYERKLFLSFLQGFLKVARNLFQNSEGWSIYTWRRFRIVTKIGVKLKKTVFVYSTSKQNRHWIFI